MDNNHLPEHVRRRVEPIIALRNPDFSVTYVVCRVCGSVDVRTGDLLVRDDVQTVSGSYDVEPCSDCREIQRHHADVYSWVMKVIKNHYFIDHCEDSNEEPSIL